MALESIDQHAKGHQPKAGADGAIRDSVLLALNAKIIQPLYEEIVQERTTVTKTTKGIKLNKKNKMQV